MVTFDAFSFSLTNACKRVKVNEKSLYVGNASSMLDLDGEHESEREREQTRARIREKNKTKMSNRVFCMGG